MQLADLYTSSDFVNFCKRYTPNFEDLIQDTMLIMASQPEKTNKAIQGGYLLPYAKTIAYFTHIKEFRQTKELDTYFYLSTRTENPNLTYQLADKVSSQVNNDLNCKENAIHAKVFLYSLEHGSMKEFSRVSKIPYRTIKLMVSQYKQRIKQCLKLEL